VGGFYIRPRRWRILRVDSTIAPIDGGRAVAWPEFAKVVASAKPATN
jgi:hypothetical protein